MATSFTAHNYSSGDSLPAANMVAVENALSDLYTQVGAINTQTAASPRPMYLTVAAVGASAPQKAAADYVCDGVNDEVQINAAIAAACPAVTTGADSQGGKVVLSAGVFTVGNGATTNAGSIKLRTGVHLQGQGQRATAIKAASNFVTYTPSLTPDAFGFAYGSGMNATIAAAGIIEYASTAGVQFVTVSDLAVIGNSSGGARVHAIKLDSSTATGSSYEFADSGNVLERLYILRPAAHGLYMVGGSGRANRVMNIRMIDNGGPVDGNSIGYLIDQADNFFHMCEVGSSANHGFWFVGSNNRITNCKSWFSGSMGTARGHGSGFFITGPRNEFSACEAQDNYGHGFVVDTWGNTLAACCADSNGWSRQQNVTTGSGFRINSSRVQVSGTAFDKRETGRRGSLTAQSWQDVGVEFTSAATGVVGQVATWQNLNGATSGTVPATFTVANT